MTQNPWCQPFDRGCFVSGAIPNYCQYQLRNTSPLYDPNDPSQQKCVTALTNACPSFTWSDVNLLSCMHGRELTDGKLYAQGMGKSSFDDLSNDQKGNYTRISAYKCWLDQTQQTQPGPQFDPLNTKSQAPCGSQLRCLVDTGAKCP